MNYDNLKQIMFKFEPETAHNIAEVGLRLLPYCRFLSQYMTYNNFITHPMLKQTIFNKEFLNPIGLAAGFDKNATMIKAMPSLGFGFSEIGTITPLAQMGNKKPRLFRYPEYNSIQNSMGFNNDGMEKISKKLSKLYPFAIPIGASIGKNKLTPQGLAIKDYEKLINKFANISDFLVINISSPNTPKLRDLQNETFIKELFTMSKELTTKPILLKLAPDMSIKQAIQLSILAVEMGANGIIANNTSLDYSLLPNAKTFGGISGEVIKEKSYQFFKGLAKELFGKTILISVGGISDANEAYKRIKAGASLVQILTGLIFKGPAINKDINLGLIKLLKQDGFKHISEAIGVDHST
jgi:dihydroorotate dehydrogenase